MIPVRQAPKYYFVEILIAVALWAALGLWARDYALAHPATSALKMLVALSPMLGIFLVVAALWRFYRRADEMQRRDLLENCAFGLMSCAILTMAARLLEPVGFPHLNVAFAWLALVPGWVGAVLYKWFRGSLADRGHARTLRAAALWAAPLIAVTIAYLFLAPMFGWPQNGKTLWLPAAACILLANAYRLFLRADRE